MTLSNSAFELAKTKEGQQGLHPSECPEVLEFYTLSVQAVQKQLQQPLEDGILGAILGFACMDVKYSLRAEVEATHLWFRHLQVTSRDQLCIYKD